MPARIHTIKGCYMEAMQTQGKRIKSAQREPHYEFAVFAVLSAVFLLTFPNLYALGKSNALYYVLPYKDFGFQSRLVVGSIVRLFTDYMTEKSIFILMIVITLLFILAASVMLGRIIRLAVRRDDVGAEMLLVLFIACPVSVQYLFTSNNIGRLDLYLILITALIMYCVPHEKAKWAVPALCAFAMIFSFNFIFLYMPVIAVIMIREYMVVRRSKSGFILSVVSCVAVAALFILFKFFPPAAAFADVAELKTYLAGITDVRGEEFLVYFDICRPMEDVYSRGADRTFSWFYELLSTYGLFSLVAAVPAVAFFVSFWLTALKNIMPKINRVFFLLCFLVPAGSLPMFLALDWDRWIPTLFISQMMLVFYLVAVGDAGTTDTLRRFRDFFSRHSLFALLCVIYLSSSILFDRYTIYKPVILKHIDKFFDFQF